jgi:uncharacterized membrane protein (UPF0127 family)
VEKTSQGTARGFAALLSVWAAVGCEPAGPRHEPADKTAAAAAPALAARDSATPASVESSSPAASGGRCVTPLAVPPPPVATPAARCPADPDGPLPLPQGAVRFADAPSAPRISVERALDDAARARGLMYRTRLDADAGMLFSWDSEAPRSFWMRNTCIPLDMLFIAADGTIVGILEQVPTLNTLPRAVPCPAKHVLEVNAGWTRQHGVVPGQKVEFET